MRRPPHSSLKGHGGREEPSTDVTCPNTRLGCLLACLGATATWTPGGDFQRSITSLGWPLAFQRDPCALTRREAHGDNRGLSSPSAPSNPQQVFCKDGVSQTDVSWLAPFPGLPPSGCSSGWRQGRRVLPLQKGSKATWSLTHLYPGKTNKQESSRNQKQATKQGC